MKPNVIFETDKDIPNKWPQMFTTGEQLTVEQAKEIIRRTDYFFSGFDFIGGNNHSFTEKYLRDSGKQQISEKFKSDRQGFYAFEQKFKEKWQYIDTQYVHNDWASCSFIGGPHGWCNPDGKILYRDNIGKYPSISEVVDDWAALLEAFPFLNINATLYDGESCQPEAKPIVTISIGNGVIRIHEDHSVQKLPRSENPAVDTFLLNMNNPLREQGLPQAWIEDFAALSRSIIDEMLSV